MDDLFFSDIPNKKNQPPKDSPDGFEIDTFSQESAPQKPPAQKFVVNLPESEKAAAPVDRTPRGKPVGQPLLRDIPPQTAPQQSTGQSRPASQAQRPVVSGARRTASQPQQQPKMPEFTPHQVAPHEVPKQQTSQARPAASRTPQSRPVQQRSAARPTQSNANLRPPARRRKSSRHTGRKAVAVLLVLVLLAGLVGLAYGYLSVGRMTFDKDYDPGNPYVAANELMHSATVTNILLIGSDARGDVEGQRSDTMLLCSVDKAHHKVKLTSFLRDSYVYIPAKGFYTKLNAAFSYGGADLLVDTIEYNFKVKIDGYVLIDFEGFVKLIDSMGGLDVEGVTEAEAKYLRDVVKIIYAKEGKNHFSGKASLWYCRIRYLDDDFHRTERQRKVIHAIISQALRAGPFKLMGIINDVMPYVTTSLSHNAVIPFGMSAVFNYIGGENPQLQIPADETWTNARVNGAAVLKLDFDRNIALLKQFIYE